MAAPSLRDEYPNLPLSSSLSEFARLIPRAAVSPSFPHLPEEPLLPSQEVGVDIRGISVDDLAEKLETNIRVAVSRKDFTRLLAKRSFFAM